MYRESLNTVLIQEAIRYNRLLKVIRTTLRDLQKALKGLVVMSEALEKMSLSLFSNIVPDMWASKAYPSLKPLGAWVLDLQARMKFLIGWVNKGIPAVFWISGFYFPQAFLTGTLQNYARKYVLSIDTINFSFQVGVFLESFVVVFNGLFVFKVQSRRPTERSADGCYISGLFLEGARWNSIKEILDESHPKELYTGAEAFNFRVILPVIFAFIYRDASNSIKTRAVSQQTVRSV